MGAVIGSSGFSYSISRTGDIGYVKIFNTKTNKQTFNIKYGIEWLGRGLRASRKDYSGAKTFFGLDGRYYHIIVSQGGQVTWGQIQSDGAVINESRAVIKHVNFYPLEVTKTTVPSTTPKPQVTTLPALPVLPVLSVPPTLETTIPEVLWYQKIINWINKIINQITTLLNH